MALKASPLDPIPCEHAARAGEILFIEGAPGRRHCGTDPAKQQRGGGIIEAVR